MKNIIHIKRDGEYKPVVSIELDKEKATNTFLLIVVTWGCEKREATFPIPASTNPYAGYNFSSAIMEYIMEELEFVFESNPQTLNLLINIASTVNRAYTIMEHCMELANEVLEHNKVMEDKDGA